MLLRCVLKVYIPLIQISLSISPFLSQFIIYQIFIVRYDATKGQQQLRRHTDSSHLSFNILLNDEFEGGGTRYVMYN